MNDLTTVMHQRVDREQPDLNRLLAGAVRDGTRIRRRRRVGYAAAGLAVGAVAGIAIGSATLSGSHAPARELQPAAGGATAGLGSGVGTDLNDDTPSPAPLRVGQSLDLGGGVTGTVVSCTQGAADPVGGNPACVLPSTYAVEGSSSLPGAGTGLAVVLTGPDQAVEDLWGNGFQSPPLDSYQGLTYALRADSPLLQPVYQGQAVAIHLAGWKLVGEVADDKQSVEGPGGAVADIVWRPAREHRSWVHSSDKGDNASTWTSRVHDGVFVTIQAGRGTTAADIRALGASLTWR